MNLDRPLLIAGIDPGVTLGYALIDFHGSIVKIKSSKDLDLDTVIAELSDQGKILVIGCDKAKIPGFVEKLSSKLGAKKVYLEEDLPRETKRSMVKDHELQNKHERDALASAIFDQKRTECLSNKIDRVLLENNKRYLSSSVKELVIKEGPSIRRALKLAEENKESLRVI